MDNLSLLIGKKILIVDDEADVVTTLTDLLDQCRIDSAADFESAERLLKANDYDLVILDIMGVRGYDLLEIARQKNFPALMLTAHAMSPDALVKSLDLGAGAYIPKEKMAEIAVFAADLIAAHQAGRQRSGNWFKKLKSFFERQFGQNWLEGYQEARAKHDWLDFDD